MEILSNGFTLDIPKGCFPLSTDSILLSDFIKLPPKARVLDLGSGCGTLGLLLCAKDEKCHVTGVEIDPLSHEGALKNIVENRLEARMESICADLGTIPHKLPKGSFDCCISNPPYFTGGPASQATPLARREDCCDLKALFTCAGKMLKYGGDFMLVHKPERLAELCAEASKAGMEPKRLTLIRHHDSGPVILVLLSCRKGGKAGLIWEELTLFHSDGTPTDYYRRLYHL